MHRNLNPPLIRLYSYKPGREGVHSIQEHPPPEHLFRADAPEIPKRLGRARGMDCAMAQHRVPPGRRKALWAVTQVLIHSPTRRVMTLHGSGLGNQVPTWEN